MDSDMKRAVLGVGMAIVITTTMDATGYAMFSALPLLPLTVIFWLWQKFSWAEMGLTRGTVDGYALALLHPLVVMG